MRKLVQLILSLTIHIMYIGNNVLKRCRGAIGKVNEQRQERIHLFITSVIVLHILELVELCGPNSIRKHQSNSTIRTDQLFIVFYIQTGGNPQVVLPKSVETVLQASNLNARDFFCVLINNYL